MEDKYMQALRQFCCKEVASFESPLTQGDSYYATDRSILVLTDKQRIGIELPITSTIKKDVFTLFPEKIDPPAQFDIDAIKDAVLKSPQLTQECGECYGSGEVECNYGHQHECPECDGTGELFLAIRAQYKGARFSMHYFEMIVRLFAQFEIKEAQVLSVSPNKAMHIVAGVFDILLMPCKQNEEDEVIEINTPA